MNHPGVVAVQPISGGPTTMPAIRYRVQLSEEDRAGLRAMLSGGEAKVRVLQRAHILRLSDEGRPQEEVAAVLHISRGTVQRISKRYCEHGLEFALAERPRPGAQPKLDGKAQALLVALACTDAPEGRECWTMQLLADELVRLEVVETISDETVRRTLKKTSRNRGR
jgi:transposase